MDRFINHGLALMFVLIFIVEPTREDTRAINGLNQAMNMSLMYFLITKICHEA